MRRIVLLVLAALLLPALPLCAQRTASDTAALRREIQKLNDGMVAAVNRGDLLAAAAFYADNATIRTQQGVDAVGRTAIDRYFQGFGRATWKLDVIEVGGTYDAPYQVGRSTLIHGARPDTSVVGFLVYWQRQQDGQLRILLDYYHGLPRR